MKFGIQLFGILNRRRDDDPIAVLRELRDMGYAIAEPCVALEPIPGLEHVIWPLERFETLAPKLRGMGFEIDSAHIFAQNLAASADKLRRLAEIHDVRRFVVKCPRELTDEALQQAALAYMQAADAVAPFGGEILIHNEAADIAARFSGRTAFERLIALCLGKVGAQVDAGWVYGGGDDPEALLWRLGGAVKSLHHKDLRRSGDKLLPSAVGKGDIDTVACFQFARAMGIPQIVDQDEFGDDPMGELAESLEALNRLGQARERTASYLNILDTQTGEVRTIRRFDGIVEAPNWLKGQNRLVFNAEGRVHTYDLDTGEIATIDTGDCDNCNNDHVISPDETAIAVSHSPKSEPWASRVYALPLSGGAPRLVTPNAPSYLHGWSPDGAELAYCAFREHDGRMEVDIYTIPVEGGEEKRLTDGGFNDGPEYSPDGKYIWFNSTRSGLMQVWRMNRDGGESIQMTSGERNNWFGHVSPDGTKVAWLSYRKGDLEPAEHLPNMQVELWIMDSDGGHPRRMVSLFGGQGSINVNSWAGDSRRLAFVSYELSHR